MLGVASIAYSIIQYKLIYNDFLKNEMYYINGNLDTILIILGFVSVCLILFGTFGLLKIFRKNSKVQKVKIKFSELMIEIVFLQ